MSGYLKEFVAEVESLAQLAERLAMEIRSLTANITEDVERDYRAGRVLARDDDD